MCSLSWFLRNSVLLLICATSAFASFPCHDSSAILAFPGAEGWGACAIGGRGGTVIKVTSLANSGAGTLRACLEASGPRTCVFDISGTIQITDPNDQILVTNGNLTIAGNTAPGEGIQIKGGKLDIHADNVIIRYLRIRPGLEVQGLLGNVRGIKILQGANDVIVDHCTFGWAADDQFGAGGGTEASSDITFSYMITHEGLLKGPTEFSRGGIISGGIGITRVSILHSLLMSSQDRAPNLSNGETQVVNNVMFNFNGATNVFPSTGPVDVEFRKNYFKSGPNGPNAGWIRTFGATHASVGASRAAASSIYLLDNMDPVRCPTLPCSGGQEGAHVRQTNGGLTVTATPLGFPAIPSESSATAALSRVLAHAGGNLPIRDRVDWRLTQGVVQGVGNTNIGDPATVGGYPTPATVTRPANYDTDGDGMPDRSEILCGFNPYNSSDGVADADGDGWTNVEEVIWPEGNPLHPAQHGTTTISVKRCDDPYAKDY